MDMSMFRKPTASSVGAGAHRRAQTRRKLDAFAELLSVEIGPAEAAVILGNTPDYGRVLLQRIIKGLGKEQCR